MAMRKNDIEQENTRRAKQNDDEDYYVDESDSDGSVEDIDLSSVDNDEQTARKRLEEYLEDKRLRKELGDDLLDIDE